MSELPPDGLPTLEQRIAGALEKLHARITNFRSSRPITSIGSDISLPAAAVPGTRHFDIPSQRLWVWANGEWISADSQRWVTSDSSTVSTTAGRWTDLGGPSLTFTLAARAVVQLHLDAELLATTWACGGTCLARAEVALVIDGTTSVRALSSSNYNVWSRRVSTAWADQSITYDSTGADFPRGAFIGIPLSAGTHTISWRYAAINETPGNLFPAPSAVSFRNRVMHLLVL